MIEPYTIDRSSSAYPMRLVNVLGEKAPHLIHCLGNKDLLLKPAVGFCGSRKASPRGLETADDCSAQSAAQKIVVVSGNAAGVDLHAHYHALLNGGDTVLVIPEGINHFRIRSQFKDVWDWSRVLVISQFKPDTPWRAYHAMARNKVILGLSSAMIVIEAGATGGTLDAGKSALDARVPLFVANYANENAEALGNKILLSLGGQPLGRSKETRRANMQRVWDASTLR